jgi:hypothetical protein
MKKAVLIAMLIFAFRTVADETPLVTTNVQVNIGNPERAIFVFGNSPGATELVIQCDIAAPFPVRGRAWIIENFGVEGEQAGSGFFPIVCTANFHFPNPIYPVTVAPTQAQTLLYNWDGTTTPITVNIISANWQSTRVGCGRSGSPCWKYGVGSSTITIAND